MSVNFCRALPVAAAACGLWLSPLSLRGDPIIAFTLTDTVGNTSTHGSSFGFEFQVNANIVVTELGVFDSSQDGLADTHNVGIWTSGRTRLASVTIPQGTSSPLTGGFRYEPLATALVLHAGQDYVPAALYPNSADTFVSGADGLVSSPDISILAGRSGNGFSFPSNSSGVYVGPNFRFTEVAAVPEPGSAFLFLGVVAGIALRLRASQRRRGS